MACRVRGTSSSYRRSGSSPACRRSTSVAKRDERGRTRALHRRLPVRQRPHRRVGTAVPRRRVPLPRLPKASRRSLSCLCDLPAGCRNDVSVRRDAYAKRAGADRFRQPASTVRSRNLFAARSARTSLRALVCAQFSGARSSIWCAGQVESRQKRSCRCDHGSILQRWALAGSEVKVALTALRIQLVPLRLRDDEGLRGLGAWPGLSPASAGSGRAGALPGRDDAAMVSTLTEFVNTHIETAFRERSRGVEDLKTEI